MANSSAIERLRALDPEQSRDAALCARDLWQQRVSVPPCCWSDRCVGPWRSLRSWDVLVCSYARPQYGWSKRSLGCSRLLALIGALGSAGVFIQKRQCIVFTDWLSKHARWGNRISRYGVYRI